jgi:hypothetical protein
LLVRSTQVPEQLVWPAGQAHAPDWQVMPPEHTLPQAPQLLVLVVVFTHLVPH